ncbi:MAG TPA: ABC transporter ATP-binding protein [Pseudonocardiaceae bacterium]|nr:ABC transporter ATP-binding protein [Pseudonocardiaceae bacterium]
MSVREAVRIALHGLRAPPTGTVPGDTSRSRDPRTIRRVVGLFWPYRGRLVLLGLVVVLTAGLGVGGLLLIKPVFDQALFCPGCPNLPLLFWLLGGMTAIPVVTGALEVCRPYLANVLGQRVMRDLRGALYTHLQRMSLRFFTETKTGEIQSRLAHDVGGLQQVVTETASAFLMNIVVVISTIGAMVVLSWQLTLLSLALVPLFVWLTERVGRVRRGVSSVTQQRMAELSTLSQETLSVSGVLLSRSFGRRHEENTRFHKLNAHLAELQVRQQMIGQGFFMSLRIFFAVMPVFAYLVAGFMLAGGGSRLSAGTLVAFTTLQMVLLPPINALFQMVVQVQSSLALFERIFGYLDLPHDIVDAPDAIDLPPERVRGAISVRAASFRYPSGDGSIPGRWALADLSLDIEPGQLAAVVGPSGSGKTTLSYLLARLYDVTEGAVLIDGLDVRRIRLDSLAATIGMVTQETHLVHASIRENLRYGDPHATDEQLEAAARAAAIHERILQLDDGYDTLVGERGYRMSGGEKQRLAIARVILKNPKILILDEATSALDTVNERLVQQALVPLMAGRTTVAIAHRLSTILAADVIFVLDRGRLVERGTHTELLDRGGVYAQLYRQQFGDQSAPSACRQIY